MASKEYTSVPIEDPKAAPAGAPGHAPAPPSALASSAPDSLPGGATRQPERKLHPIIPISFWIGSSMCVIIYNAYILKSDGLNFGYPIFLTTFHMAFAAIGTRILARYTHLMDGLNNVDMTRERWLRNILPIGALFAASLIFSNYAYLYLSVSYIQMVKAFTPVAVLLMSIAFGLKAANATQLGIVFGISCGVAIASYGEADFNLFGFILQAVAILFESTRLVMIQVLLQGLKMDPLVSVYYFAPVCAGMLAVVLPFVEGLAPFYHLRDVGAMVLLSNASCAFALNFALVFLIGAASSLVLTLAGVVKDILLIAGSMVILHSVVTGTQMFGYSIALAGLVAFKLYKA